MRPLVVVGAGGFGREVLDVVEAMNAIAPTFEFAGFLDDGHVETQLLARRNAHHLGGIGLLRDLDAEYVIGIGNGVVRRRIDEAASGWGRTAAVLIHPAATVGSDVRIGQGTVVAAGVRITTNIDLGRHVHLNLNSTVGHDAVVGDYVTVNPGATVSGNVVLEDGVNLGTGCAVIQGRTIGAGTVVGAGAVVVSDLPPGVTAVGVPAKPLAR
jgi:sugar O-acyltransferase (sialic acid O-acetyltransferase NeuD family)